MIFSCLTQQNNGQKGFAVGLTLAPIRAERTIVTDDFHSENRMQRFPALGAGKLRVGFAGDFNQSIMFIHNRNLMPSTNHTTKLKAMHSHAGAWERVREQAE